MDSEQRAMSELEIDRYRNHVVNARDFVSLIPIVIGDEVNLKVDPGRTSSDE